MPEIQLVLLVGLPGAGKSTFCRNILDHHDLLQIEGKPGINLVLVSYDRLIPESLIEKVIATDKITNEKADDLHSDILESTNSFESEEETFKSMRNEVLQKVDHLVGNILEDGVDSSQVKNSLDTLGFEHRFCESSSSTIDDNYIILVDDNFYYRSMRYEYFKLAAKHRLSYSQVFIDVDLCDALKINAIRSKEERVLDKVIRSMAAKLEKPDSIRFKWEITFSVHRSSSHVCEKCDCCYENKCKILPSNSNQTFLNSDEIFSCVYTNGFEPNTSRNVMNTYSSFLLNNLDHKIVLQDIRLSKLSLQTESRELCESNLIHNADLILRGFVKETITNLVLPYECPINVTNMLAAIKLKDLAAISNEAKKRSFCRFKEDYLPDDSLSVDKLSSILCPLYTTYVVNLAKLKGNS